MKYLLDTNAVIGLLNRTSQPLLDRIRASAPADVGVSAVVIHELYYGAYKSQRVEPNLALVDGLLFEVLEFNRDDARHAGELRAHLARAGQPIGPFDLLIAGQARARGLVLISANTTEFGRVPGLQLENWQVSQ